MNAVKDKDAEPVRQLLATPDIRVLNACREAEWTELHMAAKNGHADVVKQLLANKKIDVNAVDYFGFTPLSVAATDEIEQLLRAAGDTPPQE